MRRVYYAFALKTATHPAMLHGSFMLAFIIALTYYVSLGNVIQNIMNIQVGHLGTYLFNAVTNTEIWTLLLLGALILSAFSLRVRLKSPRMLTQTI